MALATDACRQFALTLSQDPIAGIQPETNKRREPATALLDRLASSTLQGAFSPSLRFPHFQWLVLGIETWHQKSLVKPLFGGCSVPTLKEINDFAWSDPMLDGSDIIRGFKRGPAHAQ
jgi:hypothetical protein